MSKYTENETKQQSQLNVDMIMQRSFDIVIAIVEAKGQSFNLNSKCIQEMLSTVFTQSMNFANIALGAKNPAVSVEASVTNDYIICLEDGQRVKMLKKYLNSRFGMTPADYLRKWNLPPDYPMVAPTYSKQRKMLAIATKLGHGTSRRRAAA